MTNKIATEQQAFEIGGVGSPRTNRCVTGEVATNLGCTYPDSYTNNQLIKLDDLGKASSALNFTFQAVDEIKSGNAQDTLLSGTYNVFELPDNNGQLLWRSDDIEVCQNAVYMRENGFYSAETAFTNSTFDNQAMSYIINIALPVEGCLSAEEIATSNFEFDLITSSNLDTFHFTGVVNTARRGYDCTWQYYEKGSTIVTQEGNNFMSAPSIRIETQDGKTATVVLGRAEFEVPIENSYAVNSCFLSASMIVFGRCILKSTPIE